MKPERDVIIAGGGAAGLTAAQYTARANLNTLLIEELAPGGQALIIDRLENYPGFPEPINGAEFSSKLEKQAFNFKAEILSATISSIEKKDNLFHVHTSNGEITAYTVIVSTGAKHKKLGVPGEEELSGRGVSYCATCDGPFFRGKNILVVGGGDAACDESMYLSNLSPHIMLIHRRDRFRAQKSLAERVLNNPHIEVRFNTELKEIRGDKKVEEVVLLDNKQGKTYNQVMDAVFIFIGSIPNSQFLKGVKLDKTGYIITNENMETNIRGLFAAGDVRTTPFRQLVVAAGEGAVAAHSASLYIDELKGQAYK